MVFGMILPLIGSTGLVNRDLGLLVKLVLGPVGLEQYWTSYLVEVQFQEHQYNSQGITCWC